MTNSLHPDATASQTARANAGDRRPGVYQLLTICGVAAPILFALGIVLAARQYPDYSHLTQAISELAAVNAPFPLTQTMNFFVAGVLTVAFAVSLGHHTGVRLGAALFGAIGVMLVAHGLLPCDAGCAFITWVGTAHNLSGIAGFLAAITGVWLCGRQAPRGAYRIFSSASAAVALIGFILWIALAKIQTVAAANGSLQRSFVAVLLGWMFVTALRQLATRKV